MERLVGRGTKNDSWALAHSSLELQEPVRVWGRHSTVCDFSVAQRGGWRTPTVN